MRILFWGTYDAGKPRLRILRDGLRQLGVKIEEIHRDPWEGIDDKSQIRGLGAKLRIALRWFLAYPSLALRLIKADKPDLILVSYPGLLDVFLAAVIGKIRRVPVVWNVFISLYDTVVEDRRLWKAGSFRAKLLHMLEGFALRCPKLVFLDTQAHARRIELLFSLPGGYCDAVWVGVESSAFTSASMLEPLRNDAFLRVLFYGQFIPLHGIPVIIEAARLLKEAPVKWTLIGRGQEEANVRALVDAEPLPNLHWIDWATYDQLAKHIAAADVCLGIFGTSEKAASVIPNKVFQIVASGRPLITRDSDAIRELLPHAPPCTSLIPAGNPTALAEAVMAYSRVRPDHDDLACHKNVQQRINESAVGEQFLSMLEHRLPTCPRHSGQ